MQDSTLTGFQIDQSNAEIGFPFPSQMRRCVDQHHLERRPNRACEKMATTRHAIATSPMALNTSHCSPTSIFL
jgi:hypothetical protein